MGTINSETILKSVISSLDITPSSFEVAKKRYSDVAKWLETGEYQSGSSTEIYLQGSFKLGTVIRPYRRSQDTDYDIDQVCEIKGSSTSAKQLKQDVGDRLYQHPDYRSLLDEEGRRCWTLNYSPAKEVPGFHLDILPSRPQNEISNHINITHKSGLNYNWRSSNPKDYYRWFKIKNGISDELLKEQRNFIFLENKNLYKSIEDVPKQLVRTPLQRSIQLMKRHRDVFFDRKETKPISIIITTICVHKYIGDGILETIKNFTNYVTSRHSMVLKGVELPFDGVLDYQNGNWIIKNPADENENFAEKWKDDLEKAESFFSWVYQLNRDIHAFDTSTNTRDLNLVTRSTYDQTLPYGQILLNNMNSGRVGNTYAFLDLIHQGIEGKVSWDKIKEVAKRNVDYENESDNKDVSWVNFYQVKIHSGTGLTDKDKIHINAILSKHKDDLTFVLCCNLLLGSATGTMLQECINVRGEEVIKWPITRLAKGQIRENSRMIIPVMK